MKFTNYIKQERPELSDIFDYLLSKKTISIIEDYANFVKVTNGTGVLPKPKKNSPNVHLYIDSAMCTHCGKYGKISLGFMDDENLFTCQDCLPF